MKLFGYVSFDVTVLASDVLGRTSASIVYLREKSVIRELSYKMLLPENVNLGLYFHFETN